jgi:UDP-2-acetamido-2-deoxy-ribo-hexuluronate aminotransferase
MKPIQMVDLKGQYNKIQAEIDEAVISAIRSAAFINGPQVKEFQKDLENYLGVNHVIPCANGTDALQIALMALDLQPGDEIITPSYTYIATVEVMALLKLKPVFVEVNEDTYNIDIEEIKKAITPKTKAIVPVHLYGQCADMEPILKIAKEHKLSVIEDTAQGIGAEYTFSDGSIKKAGTMGTIGCTSFFPSKNLGCYGDGGAIFCNDEELAKKIKMIANHGQSIKYHHDEIGVNSRLDTLQAAVLKIKLKHLDSYSAARNDVAKYYINEFKQIKGITTPYLSKNTTHVFHQFTLKLEGIDRDGLRTHLDSSGIPSMIYYPIPVHLQKGYAHLGYAKGSMPLTENLCANVLSLPIHTEFETDQLEYIVNTVKEFLK